MLQTLRLLTVAGACAFALGGCFAGGVFNKGGLTNMVAIAPSATMTRGAPYRVICLDQEEIKRREDLPEEELKTLGPPVRLVPMAEYDGRCSLTGEASTFFLFNLWPVTPPLDAEYAIGSAVQSVEGDTMIRIRIWHESHYYSLLGHAQVLKARGDVIRFLTDEERRVYEREQLRNRGPARPGGTR